MATEIGISLSDAFQHMPTHTPDDAQAQKIMHGKTITIQAIPPLDKNACLKVIDSDNRLTAVLDFEKDTGRYGYCYVYHHE